MTKKFNILTQNEIKNIISDSSEIIIKENNYNYTKNIIIDSYLENNSIKYYEKFNLRSHIESFEPTLKALKQKKLSLIKNLK